MTENIITRFFARALLRKLQAGSLLLLLALQLSLPARSQATYVVHLLGGEKVTTEHLWMEQDQIFFESSYGVVSLPMSMVLSVERVSRAPVASPAGPAPGNIPKQNTFEEEETVTRYEQCKVEKRAILERQSILFERIRQDGSAGRQVRASLAKKEMRTLGQRLRQLEAEARTLKGPVLPDDWFDPERSRLGEDRLSSLEQSSRLPPPAPPPDEGQASVAPSSLSEEEKEQRLRELHVAVGRSSRELAARKGEAGQQLGDQLSEELSAFEQELRSR